MEIRLPHYLTYSLLPPRCHSNTAITPIQSGISCVALTYVRDTQTCPLTPTIAPSVPRFYFFDNDMVYSTPNLTRVSLKCQSLQDKKISTDETLTLNGFGIHKLAPDCSLTLPDGTTHVNPQVTPKATELENKLFRELMQQNQPDEIVVGNTKYLFKIQFLQARLGKTDDLKQFTDKFANLKIIGTF
jgi:hypothetical protein